VNDIRLRRLARIHRLSLERQPPPRWSWSIWWLLILLALLVGYGARQLQGAERVDHVAIHVPGHRPGSPTLMRAGTEFDGRGWGAAVSHGPARVRT
jgi:hypothetical protein